MLPSLCQCSCNSPFRPRKLIENSFQSLSKEEQQRIHRDLNGFEEPIEETTEFVDGKLEELDKELDILNETSKRAYIEAKNMEKDGDATEYTSSRKFRLMFLRAERFVADKAALRLTSYLNEKLGLFGKEVLCRKIRFDDLNVQDRKALTSGFLTITNETDKAGRLVLFYRRSLLFGQDVKSLLRAGFYLVQIAVEDNEEVQKRGLVAVAFNMGAQQTQWTSEFRKYTPIYRHMAYGMPIRTAAFHILYNDVRESFLFNLVLVAFPNHLRSRFHCRNVTTHEESLFHLLSLGIDPNNLPFTEEAVFQKEKLCKHLVLCEIKEREAASY